MIPSERLGDEYLEPDGLGGFASGTVGGVRTRRYHATLLAATTPPTGRVVLVAGFDAWVEHGGTRQFLSSQRYVPDVDATEGQRRLTAFAVEPWPTWTFRLDDGTEIVQELFAVHDRAAVALRWRLRSTTRALTLVVRPFLAGRDAHALRRESAEVRLDPVSVKGEVVVWRPDASLPAVRSLANARYDHEPVWYRQFQLDEERARGYDWVEDLASPGLLRWDLSTGDAVWILEAEGAGAGVGPASAVSTYETLRSQELERRAAFRTPLHRAADAYVVRRGAGRTIVAGYPWFTDWGRDTFIGLRGLCLATGRLEDARAILLEWAGTVSAGMLPNRFIEEGDEPEFNSVDAALWYIIAVHDFLEAAERAGSPARAADGARLREAIDAILDGYSRGTRHGIAADQDGLLYAGEPGVQLTWMDAKVGDWVVTPRIGKPVEVQALWLNALRIGGAFSSRWSDAFARAAPEFARRFWLPDREYLADVVDAERVPGAVDASLRPNQLLAVGGLPWAVLEGPRAARVVAVVEQALWTPMGPRSLAPDDPAYAPRYQGDQRTRDGAYHQGTVWPWLAGPFVEAWIRVRGDTGEARAEARRRFLGPLRHHLEVAGLGHVSEIADADPPHVPRGCPFQAWSVGELLRLELEVLRATPASALRQRSRGQRGAPC